MTFTRHVEKSSPTTTATRRRTSGMRKADSKRRGDGSPTDSSKKSDVRKRQNQAEMKGKINLRRPAIGDVDWCASKGPFDACDRHAFVEVPEMGVGSRLEGSRQRVPRIEPWDGQIVMRSEDKQAYRTQTEPNMSSWTPEDVADLVEAVCRGDDNAYHVLIEASPAIVPLLIEQFEQKHDGEPRARIVKLIWQHRDPDSTNFLSMALEDSNPAVWKEALDGLVTIGGRESRNALTEFVTR